MYKQRNDRRGVVLLLVLGMLMMFALVGITFVLLAGHARVGAEAQAKVGQADNPPDRIADDVIKQVLRGATDRASVIGPHSLLEDLYGNGYAEGQLAAAPAEVVTGGQLLSFQPSAGITNPYRYVGCVLTMTNGPAAGLSTRIVGYNSNNNTFQILAFEKITTTDLIAKINAYFASSTVPISYIINSTPFSGTGFGYDPGVTGANPLLTKNDPGGYSYALSPNPRAFVPNTTMPNPYTDPAGPGGANEDYDAADYQNMLLACVVPQSGGGVAIPIPSLHRPALVNYWYQQLLNESTFHWPPAATTNDDKLKVFLDPNAWTWDDASSQERLINLKRRIILRPLREDHPYFTGSNEYFNPIWNGVLAGGGQWDVDNDGDGVMDSIWVDVGLPVRTMRDGRQYKPLAAILCLDLDGRLNLNAHGCLAQANVEAIGGLQVGAGYDCSDGTVQQIGLNQNIIAADPSNPLPVEVPRGQGAGPAEINLSPLLGNAYSQILCGNGSIEGRYGELNASPPAGPGISVQEDLLAYNIKANRPTNTTSSASSYGTPIDFKGTMGIRLDLRGQPTYENLTTLNVLRRDDPYELNLSRNAARTLPGITVSDNPFSVGELETLLRPFDVDASLLPSRISSLLTSGGMTADQLRHQVTTESWSVPCPGVALPPELRTNGAVQTWFQGQSNKANSLADLLRAKLVEFDAQLTTPQFDTPTDTVQINTMETMVNNLLDKDLRAGLKMDLNRPFGNGMDDDGDGVIDEPDETEIFYQSDQSGTPIPANFDLVRNTDANADGNVNAADQTYAQQHSLARQLYARHLYVMMLTLMNYHVANPAAPSESEQTVARSVAQWAVNIVDFRDRDSIMTAFEYDVVPFYDNSSSPDNNPWDVDGDLSAASPDNAAAYRGLVWGCERPELLITETLAFHDRRTEDWSVGNGLVGTTAPNLDDDFDQRVVPEGSLFVELYNPWTSNEPLPAEFNNATGVVLNKTTPSGNPVWRLTIPKKEDLTLDPDNPDTGKRPNPYERSVYFVTPAAGFNPADEGQEYYPGAAVSGVVAPGQYAVIAPAARTYIGGKKYSMTYDDTTRHIELKSTATPPVIVRHNRKENKNDFPDANSVQQNPVNIVVNQPRRLSVSEPTDGYSLTSVVDRPLDADDPAALMHTTTTEGYRVIHLQRLANPLQDYDPDTNPYLTIDSMPISITAFNGLSDKDDPNSSGTVKFHSRQRGDVGTAGQEWNIWTTSNSNGNDHWDYTANWLWKETIPPPPPPPPPIAPHFLTKVDVHRFDYYLKHTLGYLNDPFHYYPADIKEPTKDATIFTVGWCATSTIKDINDRDKDGDTTDEIAANVPSDYYGAPRDRDQDQNRTFPWLTWLNRPFLSEMELMLVPKLRSSQLLTQNAGGSGFSLPGGTDAFGNADQPFGHLINYFFDTLPPGNTPNWKLHRLLEFVQVPSPFVGTKLQGNPTTFDTAAIAHDYKPPFNHISNRRDPGRVNLNTITSEDVLSGLVGDFVIPTALPAFWNNVVQSRRGDNYSDMFTLDPNLPTRFANPFRSSAGCYNVPTQDLQNRVGGSTADKREVNATMLRPTGYGPTSFGTDPLFNYASPSAANDTDRNPYFRYQLLNRIGSTATTQSNVYAVWVTVGYFEVSPVDTTIFTPAHIAEVYPDGFQLGQELGADTGEITRHRAFYIIDRSIPVGFQRGEDLNVEDAILLRRFVE